MIVRQIYTKSVLRNFSYVIEGAKECFCVDPYSADQILEHLPKGKALKAIINTHEHWDHTKGNGKLKAKTGAQIWAHQNAQRSIRDMDRALVPGERIDLGGDDFLEVLDTPGHTFEHLCLLAWEKGRPKAVFTGDTLFNAGVGNCRNGGDPEVLFETITKRFGRLADDITVYPGHEYLENNLRFTLDREPGNRRASDLLAEYRALSKDKWLVTDMEEERKINTFLRLDSDEIISRLDNPREPKDVFLQLRKLRDKW